MAMYLFFYETSPLKLSKQLSDRLSPSIINQRQNFLNFKFPELPKGNNPSSKKPPQMKSNIRDTATKFDNSEKTKEFVTDMDPEDIPIDVTYSQNELLEKLQSLNISFANNTSTAKLNKTFETKLNHNHPIHQRLKEMGKRSLMDVANKIKIEFDHRLVA